MDNDLKRLLLGMVFENMLNERKCDQKALAKKAICAQQETRKIEKDGKSESMHTFSFTGPNEMTVNFVQEREEEENGDKGTVTLTIGNRKEIFTNPFASRLWKICTKAENVLRNTMTPANSAQFLREQARFMALLYNALADMIDALPAPLTDIKSDDAANETGNPDAMMDEE